MARYMIYFISAELDGYHGGSRSAVDVLENLLGLATDLTVVSRGRCSIPDEQLEGAVATRLRWLTPPPTRAGVRARAKPLRYWFGWTKALPKQLVAQLSMNAHLSRRPPVLAIQNGFPDPNSHAIRVFERARRRVMIVRSSPEAVTFFQRHKKELTVDWVATQLAHAHVLIFVSPQIRDSWSEIADISHVDQHVLPNTCREDDAAAVLSMSREALRASLDLPPNAFIAVCVAKVDPGKGQDTLVEALPGMVQAVPNLILLLVGKDSSPWAAKLKGTIHDLGLDEHVCFTGARTNPYAFISAADLMIHPSRAEGHSRVVLEAMLLRTPVLASQVAGVPSITHGETGWLVPADDHVALLNAFVTLAGDQQCRRQLAANAEREYWRSFSRQEYRKRFQAIFQGLVEADQPAALRP